MNGLYCIHLELTSRCNKKCWMCGRRKVDRENPELPNYGDMDFSLVEKIAQQVPKDIVIQFHNNGEPLLYPKLGEALSLFPNNIKCLDTNAKLIATKAKELWELDTITVSVIANDPEADEQYEEVCTFIDIRNWKSKTKPRIIYRLLGEIYDKGRWYSLAEHELGSKIKHNDTVVTRILHDPSGSFNYRRKVTIPEIGICTEALNHLAIDRLGNVSLCVRFDPHRVGVLGNLGNNTLEEIWNGNKRKEWIRLHIEGKRKEIPLCSKCHYWGIPIG